MSKKLGSFIVILSIIGGLMAYGFNDFALWIGSEMLSDSADLIASLVVITIVLVGMWTCATADAKELEFFEQEQRKEEIRQKIISRKINSVVNYEN